MSDQWKEDGAERRLHQENQELKAQVDYLRLLVGDRQEDIRILKEGRDKLRKAGEALVSAAISATWTCSPAAKAEIEGAMKIWQEAKDE